MAMARDVERMPTAINAGGSLEIDVGYKSRDEFLDDDGRAKRTGTLYTASAHIITAVIGSGVLSLAWATAQLGWIAGPVVLFIFALITWYCSIMLADCYRSPQGKRSYIYKDAVEAILGSVYCKFCGLAQYVNLIGVSIGYTITTAISMGAIRKSNCLHRNGHNATCEASTTTNMIIFAVVQMVLSQLPNFHKIWWLSIVAAIMSVVYSSIGLGLSVARIIAEGPQPARTTLTGVIVGVDVTATEKLWRTFQSLGNIAFAYSYSTVLIEIQDTLKSSPPENQVMKKASSIGVSTTTMFYMACGLLGYAAFGNIAPGNFLTGFYEPFWLIDIANICIVIHLIGAYQVFAQPVYQFIETWSRNRWPDSRFITLEHVVQVPLMGDVPLSIFRLTGRTLYVIVTAIVAMIFPFFNDFLGLIGAISFWPLTVFFPVEMYIVRAKIPRFSSMWIWLKILSTICLLASLVAACGSIRGLIHSVQHYRPFKST